MTARRPLVIINGVVQELPVGDTLESDTIPPITGPGSPPVFMFAGSPAFGTAGVSLAAPAYPSGGNAPVAGELLELVCVASSVVGLVVTTPSGWTKVYEGGDANVQLTIFHKFSDGTETGTVTLAFTGAVNGRNGALISRFSNVDSATPYQSITTHFTAASSAWVGNAIATTVANALLRDIYFSLANLVSSPNLGWTETHDFGQSGAGPDFSTAGEYKVASISGSQAAGSVTPIGGPADYWCFTYALLPTP